MITETLRWARARKRYKAGTTFDTGYSQAVVQTGIISMSRSASLDVAYLFISLQSGAIFIAASYELPVQCEHVFIHFPRLHPSYANSVSKLITTSFSMGAHPPFFF